MAFVFGDTLVCDDAESAKVVTFSPQVGGVRSVTLDGDVYDPSGTLSGGSAPSSNGTLVKVQELLEAERKLSEAKAKLVELEKAEQTGREKREKWKRLERELEIKEHEMSLLREQVEGSNAARVRPCLLSVLSFRG
jgi:structural maintenance of chromosome 2